MNDELLTVLVRFHDPERAALLDEALFSLAVQDRHPLEVLVLVQGEAPAAAARAAAAGQPWDPADRVEVVVVPAAPGRDARSALLNRGIARAGGRYLAFLDDDDVVYQRGYAALVGALRAGPAAVAIGGARRARLRRAGDHWLVAHKGPFAPRVAAGPALRRAELFADNFVPIHSYVIDRARTGPVALGFDESLARLEDYDLLLRLAAGCALDWSCFETPVCEYRLREDGSNTVLFPEHAEAAPERRASWAAARSELARRRGALRCEQRGDELVALGRVVQELESLRAEVAAERASLAHAAARRARELLPAGLRTLLGRAGRALLRRGRPRSS